MTKRKMKRKKKYTTFPKITPRKIIKSIELYQYFKDELDIDIMINRRKCLLTEYRSLFNFILLRKYRIGYSGIAQFYRSQGWLTMSHATIMNSVNMFKIYAKDMPELYDLFFELHPSAKKNKEFNLSVRYIYNKDLTEIQKEVTGLTHSQEKELLEIITLRKKSWLWKNNNETKIYTGS